jgi:hypothetical protein
MSNCRSRHDTGPHRSHNPRRPVSPRPVDENALKHLPEEALMPTTKKKAKAAARSSVAKQAKPKAKKTAKQSAAAPVNWSDTIAKAAEQKRTQAHWPGTGESWKKKVRI